jgi:hypothetical protein
MLDQEAGGQMVMHPRLRPMVFCLGMVVGLGVMPSGCASTARPQGASSELPLSLTPGQRLAVIGIRPNEAQGTAAADQTLKNARVGFGLTSLLAESLFDSGKFRLVEEKDLQQRDLLADMVQTYWLRRRPPYTLPELRRVAHDLDTELLAYGSILYTRQTGQRLAVGPISHRTDTLHLAVDVCLYAAATRRRLCRDGTGQAQQQGTGVVYEFHGDRLDFVNNATGRATRQAITRAVHDLVASIRFETQ